MKRFFIHGEISVCLLSPLTSAVKFDLNVTKGIDIFDEVELDSCVKVSSKGVYSCELTPSFAPHQRVILIAYKVEKKFSLKDVPMRLLPSWQESDNCTNFLILYEMNPKVPKIVDCVVAVCVNTLPENTTINMRPDGKIDEGRNRFYWVIGEITNKMRKGKLIAQFVTPNKVKTSDVDVAIDYTVDGMLLSGFDFEVVVKQGQIMVAQIEKSFHTGFYFARQ